MTEALKNLMGRLPDDVDGALITSDLNRRYLTGMKSSAGTLLFTREHAQFIIDSRYIEKAQKVITDFPVVLQKNLCEQITAFFAEEKAKRIAVETETMTLLDYHHYAEKMPALTLLADDRLSNEVNLLRSFKSPQEVEAIKRAQAITDDTFSHILSYIKPGVSEREIALEMEYHMRKQGASGLAFETIAVSGVNSSMPHGVPTDKKVENGDFITMDFGASYDGYCSDMTRTVAVGSVTDKQRHVYDTVLKAHLMAAAAAAPGKTYAEIDKIARDHIDGNGYAGKFGHGLGHSLGLFIHEEPRFSPSCTEVIKPGVIMTVEPGIYLPGEFGVRIEDMILITETGAEGLTHSKKELIIL